MHLTLFQSRLIAACAAKYGTPRNVLDAAIAVTIYLILCFFKPFLMPAHA